MRTILILLFLCIIVMTIYLPLKNNEKFITCLPNTYKGTALQSYENLFKGGCFMELDEKYNNEIRDDSVVESSHLPSGSKYCFNSIRAPALFSYKNEIKPWCHYPSP